MHIPLYSYVLEFHGFIPERRALKLERDGLAKIVRKRKGRIARVVMHQRPGDPYPASVRDYVGKGYSFKHHLDDGQRPWALKPLAGRPSRHDQNIEYPLAPESLRPIVTRVLLECLAPAAA